MIGIVRSKRISDGDGIRLPNISVVFDDQNGGMRMEVCVHWSNLGTPPMVAQDLAEVNAGPRLMALGMRVAKGGPAFLWKFARVPRMTRNRTPAFPFACLLLLGTVARAQVPPAGTSQPKLPVVRLIATGGTIAMKIDP